MFPFCYFFKLTSILLRLYKWNHSYYHASSGSIIWHLCVIVALLVELIINWISVFLTREMDWILTPVTLVSRILRKLASPIFWYYGFSVLTGQFSFFLFIMVVSIIIIIIIIIIYLFFRLYADLSPLSFVNAYKLMGLPLSSRFLRNCPPTPPLNQHFTLMIY